MDRLPEVLFVLDVGYEHNAISEAHKLGIPVVGIVDTNNNPTGIDFIIPGNDDSIRAVQLYVQSAATAILQGKANSLSVPSSEDDFVEMDAAPAPAATAE
jgi:small subunit ribosomal protein S2